MRLIRKKIPGFPDYFAGNDGKIWSFKSGEWKSLRSSPNTKGYHRVVLHANRKSVGFLVHVLVLTTFKCPKPTGMQCRHRDRNPGNNRPSNLRWGTPKQNARDRSRHGTHKGFHTGSSVPRKPKGEKNHFAKMNLMKVEMIRSLRDRGWSIESLMRRYKLSESGIRSIINRETWSHT